MVRFIHTDIKLITPEFDSELTDLLFDLNGLRERTLSGTTHIEVFFQLKSIFHTLESIGSARIEGNNTTISEFIESKIENREYVDEQIQEIRNIENCINYIEDDSKGITINRRFFSDLHKMIVKDLTPPPNGEGDMTPGIYRNHSVEIVGSLHKPPETEEQVVEYMEELCDFVNTPLPLKSELLKISLAHHRFMWIHPFGNGNGRVGRLFTYALLVKGGFNVHVGRILNPTAIFCNDRNEYYNYLSEADKGNTKGLTSWCTYVLNGLKLEIDKIDRLSDYSYLKSSILIPAIEHSKKMGYIDKKEYKILRFILEKQRVQNSDLRSIFKDSHEGSISRFIRNLKTKGMIMSEENNSRKYHINFINNLLMRGVIIKLDDEGFVPPRIGNKSN